MSSEMGIEGPKPQPRLGIYWLPQGQLLSILKGEREIAGFPADAVIEDCFYDWSMRSFGLRIRSESFAEVQEGCRIPDVGIAVTHPCTFRTEMVGDRYFAVQENAERLESADGKVKFREWF